MCIFYTIALMFPRAHLLSLESGVAVVVVFFLFFFGGGGGGGGMN